MIYANENGSYTLPKDAHTIEEILMNRLQRLGWTHDIIVNFYVDPDDEWTPEKRTVGVIKKTEPVLVREKENRVHEKILLEDTSEKNINKMFNWLLWSTNDGYCYRDHDGELTNLELRE